MTDLLPKTPQDAEALMIRAILSLAYAELARAAVKKRLTEHDIAVIERNALGELQALFATAGEFSGFELEPVLASTRASLRLQFEQMARGRRAERPL
jgi:hypothetical protein